MKSFSSCAMQDESSQLLLFLKCCLYLNCFLKSQMTGDICQFNGSKGDIFLQNLHTSMETEWLKYSLLSLNSWVNVRLLAFLSFLLKKPRFVCLMGSTSRVQEMFIPGLTAPEKANRVFRLSRNTHRSDGQWLFTGPYLVYCGSFPPCRSGHIK